MVGWHHRLNGHESELTPRDSEGQGSLASCSSRGCKESVMTERLRNSISGVLSKASSVVSTRVCAGGRMQLSETLRAAAHQAPLSMPFIPGKDTREDAISFSKGSSWPKD